MPPTPKTNDKPSSEELVQTNVPLIMNAIEEAIVDGRATVSTSNDEKDTIKITIYTNGDPNSKSTENIVNDEHWKRGLGKAGHEIKCELGMCHPEVPKSAPMPKYDTATEISDQVPCTNNEGNPSGCDGSGGAMHQDLATSNSTNSTLLKRHNLVDDEFENHHAVKHVMSIYDNATDLSTSIPCTSNNGHQSGCEGSGGALHPRSLGMNTVIDTVAKPHFVAQPFVILFGILFGMLLLFFFGKKAKKCLEKRKKRKNATVLPRFEREMVEKDDSDEETQLDSLNLVVVDLD